MTIRHVSTSSGTRLNFNRGAFGNLKDRVGKSRLGTVGAHMQGQLRETLTGARSGRFYPHPWGGTYQASAPGEPPAKRTGELRDSIAWNLEQTTRRDMTVEVGTDREYGIMLEKGTRRIAPRPWLKVTFERNRGTIRSIMERRWN